LPKVRKCDRVGRSSFQICPSHSDRHFHSAGVVDSWNRYAVQVPLDRAAIESIDVWRRTKHYPSGFDPARFRQLCYFLLEVKSSPRRERAAAAEWADVPAKCATLHRN